MNRLFVGPTETALGTAPEYGMPLDHTSARLKEIGTAKIIPWGYYTVSQDPMTSFGFTCCRALVVYNEDIFGLAHVYGLCDDPGDYVDGLLKEFRPNGISGALVVSSFNRNASDIESACRSRGVNIVDFRTTDYKDDRDVIVLPSSREIEIYTERSRTVLSVDDRIKIEYGL